MPYNSTSKDLAGKAVQIVKGTLGRKWLKPNKVVTQKQVRGIVD